MPPFIVAITGGATMAGTPSNNSIGMKVAASAKAALAKEKLNIKIDQTGGANIRSMVLNIETGQMQIK